MNINMNWKKVGVIGVDAGCCWLGDPCYCVTPDRDCHPASTWQKFCDILQDKDFDQKGHLQFNYPLGHPGLGVLVQAGHGDGEYPVYIKKNNEGRVLAVMVNFGDGDKEDG